MLKPLKKKDPAKATAPGVSHEEIVKFWEVSLPEGKLNGVNSLKEAGDRLLSLGIISELTYLEKLSKLLGVPYITFSEKDLKEAPTLDIPVARMRSRKFFPFKETAEELLVAMANPEDLYVVEYLRKITGKRIKIFLCSDTKIEEAINRVYGRERNTPDISVNEEDLDALVDLASEAPIIKLVNSIISRAVEEHASDVHIEPSEEDVRIRYRIDGILREVDILPKSLLPAVVSRIKIMARLDIAERRLPQDGRIKTKAAGKDIDIRVATLPSIYGEQVVMRILDQSGMDWNIDNLGFEEDTKEKFLEAIRSSHGIVLVTGPTGAGKTTTLYSALRVLNSKEVKIITIEDPVEYVIPGIVQVQVKPQIGLTFASGLRSIVRQDPDIIMVGEIRDAETADIAIHAALTGHLVLSTLHTNDAASAITRLVDMGIERFLVASSVIAILAQRLVRTICPHCKEEIPVPPSVTERFGLEGHIYRGKGCDFCKGTGYYGRTGIYELLVVDEDVRKLTIQGADSESIKSKAIEKGMRPLLEDGLTKVKKGITTLEEVLRVARTIG